MGSGCLSPKPLEGQLIITLIETIHQQAPASRQSPYESNDYQNIKQKTFKKAPLRKLIDYLSSHRHKIVEAALYNFKVCTQAGKETNWMIGLALLQRIIAMTGAIIGPSTTLNIQNILRTKHQNENSQSETKKTDMRTLKTATEKQNVSDYLQIAPSTDLIQKQILNSRFQSVVLSMISACLGDQNLYKQALRVVGDYTKLGNTCFQCDDKLYQILEGLLDNIRINYETSISIQVYFRLILKMKDKSVLPLIGKLKYFIKFWIQSKNNVKSTKSLKLIAKTEDSISFIELIIGRFFTSALNGMQYKSSINILLELYDQYKFQILQQFQELYILILKNSDLGQHFLKGLFLQFLNYGILGNRQILSQQCDQLRSLANTKQTKYRNIQNKSTKDSLFSLIKSWVIEYKYIRLQQIIKYHSSLFLYCFALNIQQQSTTSFQTTHLIFKQIIKCITIQQKIIIIQTIFQQYQKQQTTAALRPLLLTLAHNIYAPLSSITLNGNLSRYTINISHLSLDQCESLYKGVMSLYKKYDRETVVMHMQQICQLLASICGYFNDKQEEGKLVDETVSFCQILLDSADGIVIAFYHKINRIIQRKKSHNQYFQTFEQLKLKLKLIFKNNGIQQFDQTLFQIEDDNFRSQKRISCPRNKQSLLHCSNYFKDLLNWQGKSKIQPRDVNFQKVASIIKDSTDLKQDQESFNDVLDMIKI